MSLKKISSLIENNDVKFFDLRFTDLLGRQHHLTVPVSAVKNDLEEWIENGQPFDGSSLVGWKGIQASDMLLKVDPQTACLDPFYDHPTIVLIADVIDPVDGRGYLRCPRSIAKRAENYLKQSQTGDQAYFGPEPEFFIFDSVRFKNDIEHSFIKIKSSEGMWSSSKKLGGFNSAHRSGLKGGYLPVPPADSLQDIRSAICEILEEIGIPVEVHHHEVAHCGQCEIGTKFSTLTNRADWIQTFKYVVKNVAESYSKTATFMPKPVPGDNGSGMHVHQSIWKDGQNTFSGEGYAGLSQTALYYIGGIIKHAKALNAITNPTTNSYKRLVPHFEAPVKLAYSAKNRSASVRIPYTPSSKTRRIEVRFPDPSANPYLAFAALLMAGLDGIHNKINPGDPADKNLYDLPPEEDKKIPTVAADLYEAIQALDQDRDFLKAGDVFSDDLIDTIIELKMQEVNTLRMTPTPSEFQLYYTI